MIKSLFIWLGIIVFSSVSGLLLLMFFALSMSKDFAPAILILLMALFNAFLAFRLFKLRGKIKQRLSVERPITKSLQKPVEKPTKPVTAKYKRTLITKIEDPAYSGSFNPRSFVNSELSGKTMQLLESLAIIAETKSIDTLSGRISFVNSFYEEFIWAHTQPAYSRIVQQSVDQYKALYYDKFIQDYQLSLLLKPNILDLKTFYAASIYNAFQRYADIQEREMQALKTEKAKERRKEKIISVGYSAQYLFKTFEIPDHHDIQGKIEDIRKNYYSYQPPL